MGKYNSTEIALGIKDGIGNIYKYGENSLITTTEAPIWDKGGAYYWHPFTTPAVKLQVVSTDAGDVNLGAGAWAVEIWGLGENYEYQKETVILNGLTPVETQKVYRRTFRGIIQGGGSRSGLIGNLDIYETGVPANVVAHIKAGDNQTHMTIFTVPAGYFMLIDNADANVGRGFDAKIKLKTHANETGNEVDLVKATRHLYQNSFTRVYKTPRFVDEKVDIWMSAKSGTGTVVGSASFEGRIFDKTKFSNAGGIIVPLVN
jgi:hypothetical protein